MSQKSIVPYIFGINVKEAAEYVQLLLYQWYNQFNSAKYLIVLTIWLVYEFSLSYQDTTCTS